MEPLTTAIITALVSSLVSSGIGAATTPDTTKTSHTPPPAPEQMDFNQLVGQLQQQGQSARPRLQLQNRLPPPQY